jgi:hypothetical protein
MHTKNIVVIDPNLLVLFQVSVNSVFILRTLKCAGKVLRFGAG